MKKYIIERAVTGIGKSDQKGLSDASHKYNDALAKLTPHIQWQESYVTPIRPSASIWLRMRRSYGNILVSPAFRRRSSRRLRRSSTPRPPYS
jgi:hypothetical protein